MIVIVVGIVVGGVTNVNGKGVGCAVVVGVAPEAAATGTLCFSGRGQATKAAEKKPVKKIKVVAARHTDISMDRPIPRPR